MVGPARKREAVGHLRRSLEMSERRACKVVGQPRSTQRYAVEPSEEEDRLRILRNRLEEGNWLLLLEQASGQEVPWSLVQQARPKAVIRLGED